MHTVSSWPISSKTFVGCWYISHYKLYMWLQTSPGNKLKCGEFIICMYYWNIPPNQLYWYCISISVRSINHQMLLVSVCPCADTVYQGHPDQGHPDQWPVVLYIVIPNILQGFIQIPAFWSWWCCFRVITCTWPCFTIDECYHCHCHHTLHVKTDILYVVPSVVMCFWGAHYRAPLAHTYNLQL